MNANAEKLQLRKAAILAGTAIVAMALIAGYAYGFVLQNLFTSGDVTTTGTLTGRQLLLLRSAIFGFVLILVCDVLAAWGLWLFLKPVHKDLSLLTALFRVIYACLLGASLFNLLKIIQIPDAEAQTGSVFTVFGDFQQAWSLSLILFGIHLLLLGSLVLRSGQMPKALAVLLLLAAVCYLGDNSLNLLVPTYGSLRPTVTTIISLPMAAGELAFGLWLLFRGGRAGN